MPVFTTVKRKLWPDMTIMNEEELDDYIASHTPEVNRYNRKLRLLTWLKVINSGVQFFGAIVTFKKLMKLKPASKTDLLRVDITDGQV